MEKLQGRSAVSTRGSPSATWGPGGAGDRPRRRRRRRRLQPAHRALPDPRRGQQDGGRGQPPHLLAVRQAQHAGALAARPRRRRLRAARRRHHAAARRRLRVLHAVHVHLHEEPARARLPATHPAPRRRRPRLLTLKCNLNEKPRTCETLTGRANVRGDPGCGPIPPSHPPPLLPRLPRLPPAHPLPPSSPVMPFLYEITYNALRPWVIEWAMRRWSCIHSCVLRQARRRVVPGRPHRQPPPQPPLRRAGGADVAPPRRPAAKAAAPAIVFHVYATVSRTAPTTIGSSTPRTRRSSSNGDGRPAVQPRAADGGDPPGRRARARGVAQAAEHAVGTSGGSTTC